jgi:hypothetical protein
MTRPRLQSDSMAKRRAKLASGECCAGCWLPRASCICEESSAALIAGMPHRVILYCHHKEFGKVAPSSRCAKPPARRRGVRPPRAPRPCQVSNTGGLLLSVLPPPLARVLVAGLPDDEAALDALLAASRPGARAPPPRLTRRGTRSGRR